MSENQTETDLIELESLNRVSSLSNNSDSSTSSRSTLIRELITSQSSKQIIDEIDSKISQLVEVIKHKNCNEKRKKYYTKKIVSRIIDNKCSDVTVNTINFQHSDLPTSTPYDSKITQKTSPTSKKQTTPPSNDSIEKQLIDFHLEIANVPTNTSPDNISPAQYDSTPLTSNRACDLKQRLKRLAEEIENYTKTPSSLSPAHEQQISEATDKLEKNLDVLKSTQSLGLKVSEPNVQNVEVQCSPLQVDELVQTSFDVTVRNHQKNNGSSPIQRDDQIKTALDLKTVVKHEKTNRSSPLQGDNQIQITYNLKTVHRHEKSNRSSPIQTDNQIQRGPDFKTVQKPEKSNCPSPKQKDEQSQTSPDHKKTQAPLKPARKSRQSPQQKDEEIQTSPELSQATQDNKKKPKLPLQKDEQIQTSFKQQIKNGGKNVQNDNATKKSDKFDDLTPKSLSLAYKTEFGDHKTESGDRKAEFGVLKNSGDPTAGDGNAFSPREIDLGDRNTEQQADLIDLDTDVQNKDWKNYKTASEKIFEKNQISRRMAKEYILRYAKREKERQIEWITNEIQSLSKLKTTLEQNSVENLSLSSLSSANSGESIKGNVNCSGAKTLQEINICLEELRQILQEKKCNVKNGVKTIDSSSSSHTDTTTKYLPVPPKLEVETQQKIESVQSGTESSTSYQNLCTQFKNPTDFEVKYFRSNNFISSSSEDNKENDKSRDNFAPDMVISRKSIEVQTSITSSPRFSRECLAGGDASARNTNSERTNITKTQSVAYVLTFEESKSLNGYKDKPKSSKTSLERIVMKIPPPRLKKSKFTTANSSEMDLQEALVKNRSDFVKAAEWRRQCINELTYMRDKRYDEINKRILFTTKEMRDITSKRYKYTPEVQNKFKEQKAELQKMFNRQLATVFSKKLQEKTLKGQVTLDTARPVTYS